MSPQPKRAPKRVQKARAQPKRRIATAPRRQQKAVVPQVQKPQINVQNLAQFSTLRPHFAARTPLYTFNSAQQRQSLSVMQQAKRDMSVLTGIHLKTLVPCDPRFPDDEVISVFNKKTGCIEPVIVAVIEPSFEWLFSSPPDLHTFDVIPVVKDCVDPDSPVFEAMEG